MDLSQSHSPQTMFMWLPGPSGSGWLLSAFCGLHLVQVLFPSSSVFGATALFLGVNFFCHNSLSLHGSLAVSPPILGFFFLGISVGLPMEPSSHFMPLSFCWGSPPFPEGGTSSRTLSASGNSPLPELKSLLHLWVVVAIKEWWFRVSLPNT